MGPPLSTQSMQLQLGIHTKLWKCKASEHSAALRYTYSAIILAMHGMQGCLLSAAVHVCVKTVTSAHQLIIIQF